MGDGIDKPPAGALQAVQMEAFVIGGQNAAATYMDGRVCEVGLWEVDADPAGAVVVLRTMDEGAVGLLMV